MPSAYLRTRRVSLAR